MIFIDEVIKDDNDVIQYVYWIADELNIKATKCTSKSEMIKYINQYPNSVKTKYKRCGIWFDGEYVRVVDNSYLRTDANYIRCDNLENL